MTPCLPLFRFILILFLGSLGCLAPSMALAEEEEADFSFFHDPNEVMPSEKGRTEAEPPCITCSSGVSKSNSAVDVKKVVEKAAAKKKIVSAKKEEACISCGKVKLAPAPKKAAASANLWSQYPQISGYSENSQVKAMISYAERHSHSVSRGVCYRYVKEALCRAPRGGRCKGGSLVSKYLHGTPVFPEVPSRSNPKIGQNAIKNLKAEGFINLLDTAEFNSMIVNPAAAPKGAIMVYQGGKNGGHIEIKTGHGTSGSYVSDYRAPDSVMKNELAGRASRNYKLVGVMIKPAEKL